VRCVETESGLVDAHNDVTGQILGAAFEVSRVLGSGFLEKVYERALARELALRGLKVETQVGYPVMYKGYRVGEYYADLVVEDAVVVELKCVERILGEHLAQCINYLSAARLRVALLVNFQRSKLEWRRVVQG
jgi:GxxExxY protein